MIKTYRNQKRILALTVSVLVFVLSYQNGYAQETSTDVSQNVDINSLEIDLQSVDQKSNSNSNKVTGVESRLSMVESKDITTGSDVAALATGQAAHAGRLTTLEAAPSIDPMIESRVAALESAPSYDDSALSARVSTLETAETTVAKWVARDAVGTYIAEWFDRAAVGVAFVYVNSQTEETRITIDPTGVRWIGIIPPGGARIFPNPTCGLDGTAPMIQVSKFVPADLSSGDFFGGMIEGSMVEDASGVINVFRFDSTQVVPHSGDTFGNVGGGCQAAVRNPDVYMSGFAFSLPMFTAPFAVVQE